ncbi:MAG: alpha/beta hydrolase [Candidatus Acidiferrales bacterium]
MAATIVIVCTAAIAGATYELICEHNDARRFPQEGRSVDVGGFRLNIHCTGTGAPPVILDSGLGIPAMGWDLVQPGVQKFTQVCSYDRAGYGWSEPGRTPRTSREIAKELHRLLQNAGLRPPFILVGHSFGGFNVRVFNGLYPDEVAGMVLVDSSHADQRIPTPSQAAAERREDEETRMFARVYPVLFHLGVARFFLATDRTPLPEHMDAGLRYLLLKPPHVQAMIGEELASAESAEQVRESGNLGDKPLVVLTAGIGHTPASVELEQELTRLSTDSQQIVVHNSGHLIPFEQPQAVVGAIRSVFDICPHSR